MDLVFSPHVTLYFTIFNRHICRHLSEHLLVSRNYHCKSILPRIAVLAADVSELVIAAIIVPMQL